MKYEATIDLTKKNNSHTLAFDFIQKHGVVRRLKILEVGCSTGCFGKALVDAGHEVWGIEQDIESAAVAKNILHIVHNCSIEDFLAENIAIVFDVITFGDVLEHLVDPETTLKQCVKYLSDEGFIVASIPNVAHFGIRAMLLEGRWDYSDLGLMDKTHLRFFTKVSIIDLFSDSGYLIDRMKAVQLPVSVVNEVCDLKLSDDSIACVTNYCFDSFGNDFQYIVSAHPSTCSENPYANNNDFLSLHGLNVIALVSDTTSSLADIRISKPLEIFASNFHCDFHVGHLSDISRLDINSADIIIFQRVANEFSLDFAKKAKNAGKMIVFEIDDLLIDMPDFLDHHKQYLDPIRPYMIEMLRIVDAVSTSTSELAEELRQYTHNIFITPNYSTAMSNISVHTDVPADEISLIVASSDDVIVDMLFEPLNILQHEYNVKIIAIGPPSNRLSDACIKVIPISNMPHDEFRGFIASINNGIGLIPLDESKFSSCKSPIKYFDYSMCGIPVICSNVLPYSAVVEEGTTGFLVDNDTKAWTSAIKKLIADHQLRTTTSLNARNNVLASHNIHSNAHGWRELFSSICTNRETRKSSNIELSLPKASLRHASKRIMIHIVRPSSYVKGYKLFRRYGLRELFYRVFLA